jgi:DNA-binding GntR family transcriptional regulator
MSSGSKTGQTAADVAYRGLRAAILEGRYELGSRLSEVQLAKDLQVSRTPVREALRRLASEGFIELAVNRVARVATWSPRDFEEVYELRALLESYAASRAATMITPEQLMLLSHLCDEEEAAVLSADVESVIHLNARFHSTVVEAAGNDRLRGLIVPLLEIPSVLRIAGHHNDEHLRCNWRDHAALIEALSSQDGEWAASAMRAHMLGEKERLLRERRQGTAASGDGA